jgi:hypothetical protein
MTQVTTKDLPERNFAPDERHLHYPNDERRVFFDSYDGRFIKVVAKNNNDGYNLYSVNDEFIKHIERQAFKDFWVELKPIPQRATERPKDYITDWIRQKVLHEGRVEGGIRYAIGATDLV